MATNYTLGEVSLPLDPKSLLTSFDALDKLDAGGWQKMAAAAKLPIEPFEKRLLKPVLMGLLQAEWYKQVEGKVPEICVSNQARRVARYKQQIEDLKNNVDGKDQVRPDGSTHKAKKEGAVPKAAQKYRLAKGTDPDKFSGQKYVVLATIAALDPKGVGVYARDVVEKQAKFPGIIAPSDKNVAFHLNGMSKAGLIEALDEKGEVVQKSAPPKEEPKETAKKK